MNAATAIEATGDEAPAETARIARPRAFGFAVPSWAHYVAIDLQGRAFAFACEPTRFDRWGVWNVDGLGGRMECIGDFEKNVDGWQNSLLRWEPRGFWTPVFAYHIDRDLEPKAADAAVEEPDWAGLALACVICGVLAAGVALAVAGDRFAAWWHGVLL